MKININNDVYGISHTEEALLLKQLQDAMLDVYGKLSPDMRFAAKPFARGFLQKLENEARAKHGKEQSLVFRPDKKADAVVHLSNIMVLILREALKDVEISISTDADTVTALALKLPNKGEAGGSLAAHGNIGQREDNRAEVS